MPSSSSIPPAAAKQLSSADVVAASTSPRTAAGPNQPPRGLLALPTEILLTIFGYVLVEEDRLSPSLTRSRREEPVLRAHPRILSTQTAPPKARVLMPMLEILSIGLVVKRLLPIVREAFFGKNRFDLSFGQKWLSGVHPDLQTLIHDVEICVSSFGMNHLPRSSVDFSQHHLKIRRLRVLISARAFEWHVYHPRQQGGQTSWDHVFRTAPEVRALSGLRDVGEVTVDFKYPSRLLFIAPAPGWLLAQATWLKNTMEQD
ncbi:hypothetical protein J4E93_001509 [Alternaria ventricosa]|uniref:uncharacterized protein n=1 Tax=Alternaria ventricosa TaxID=1187951 RepID=UPI0020C39CFE|nr:uncharacterized protein J4E93_001509 [Alternaria ventricosa]KAI4653742.1 hypothetical protein J4E93_001509 [Alternaria ventricosa]